MENEDQVLLGKAEFSEANRLKSALAAREVEVTLANNPETCKTGCKPAVELWVLKKDLPAVQQFLHEQSSKLYADLNVDPNLINQTFDTSKENATCPACGTEFKTVQNECPDCGLMFTIPVSDEQTDTDGDSH